ncbi:MAG: hypothetical protein JNL71_15020 [Rhodospirillales bacterium]|nr:hypothetical protein [Rhodospirillales bacterium]
MAPPSLPAARKPPPQGPGIDDQGVILRLIGTTLVFISVMGVIGYFVTRFPELLTSDSIAVVDGVAVSVPDERNAGEPQTYRCRMSKEFVMEPGSTRVATTVHRTACGYENTSGR